MPFRTTIFLNEAEANELDTLPAEPEAAWNLWHRIGARLGVDFTRSLVIGRTSRTAFRIAVM